MCLMLDVLWGSCIAVLSALLILGFAAFLISAGLIADSRMNSVVTAACLVGAFLGGVVAVMRRRLMTLAVGIAVGGVFFILLLTVGLLIFGGGDSPYGSGSILSSCLCGGGLAGIVGSSPKKKRRR